MQNVFRQTEVLQDDVNHALKAVTQLDPDFEVQEVKAPTEFACNLVNELNKTIYSTKVLYVLFTSFRFLIYNKSRSLGK